VSQGRASPVFVPFRDEGFAVQDGTAGIYVSSAFVVRLRGARRVSPDFVATADVGEATEGSLLAVRGTITRIVVDLPFGFQVFINDGSGETQVFIAASTGIDPRTIPFMTVGRRIYAVGLSGQFLAQNEVLPRNRGDLRPAH
jgi:DNA/RNA endonuclease YhcR with UshA esterase domain